MCRKITTNGVKKVFYFYVKMTKLWQIDVITAACHDEKDHIGNFSWILKLSYYIELEISVVTALKDYHILFRICKRLFHKVIQTCRRSISSNELLFIHVYLQLKFFRPIQFLYYPISCFSFSTDPTDKRNFINKREKKGIPYRLVNSMRLLAWSEDSNCLFGPIRKL